MIVTASKFCHALKLDRAALVCATKVFPEVLAEVTQNGPGLVAIILIQSCCSRGVYSMPDKVALKRSLMGSLFWYREGEFRFTHAHVPLI